MWARIRCFPVEFVASAGAIFSGVLFFIRLFSPGLSSDTVIIDATHSLPLGIIWSIMYIVAGVLVPIGLVSFRPQVEALGLLPFIGALLTNAYSILSEIGLSTAPTIMVHFTVAVAFVFRLFQIARGYERVEFHNTIVIPEDDVHVDSEDSMLVVPKGVE